MGDGLQLVVGSASGRSFPPQWAPRRKDLEYVKTLLEVGFLLLGIMYFLGFNGLRPFARRHVAAI